MSLSNLSTDTSKWGTIFMGPGRMHETSLSRLESARSGPVWNEATEAEYFERVRAKAAAKACVAFSPFGKSRAARKAVSTVSASLLAMVASQSFNP